jgi:DNA-binding transcriptional LysR family regulator
MLDIRSIQLIRKLVEYKNFGKAAKSLHMTQPALTKAIQKIEARLGVTLFDRTKRRVEPTSFATLIVNRGIQILADARELEHEIDLMKDVQTGRVSIVINPPYADVALGSILHEFTQRYPSIHLNIDVELWKEAEEDIRLGNKDLFIGPLNGIETNGPYQTLFLQELTAWCYCRAGHPILNNTPINNDHLMHYQFARPPLDREQLFLELPDSEREEHQTIVCEHYAIIRDMVINSDIISAGTMTMIERELNEGTVVPIMRDRPLVVADEGIVYLNKRTLSPAVEAFIHCAQTACIKLHEKEIKLRKKFGGDALNFE